MNALHLPVPRMKHSTE